MDCTGLAAGRKEKHEDRKMEIGLPADFKHTFHMNADDFASGRIDLGSLLGISEEKENQDTGIALSGPGLIDLTTGETVQMAPAQNTPTNRNKK